MSLISARNFIAPFRNGVHLVTIIVVALLFGIYRLSGGGVKFATKGEILPGEQSRTSGMSTVQERDQKGKSDLTFDPRAEIERLGSSRAAAPKTEPKREDILGEIIGQESNPAQKKQAEDRAKGLEDIEKSLGLR